MNDNQAERPMTGEKELLSICILLIILSGLAVYANSLDGKFVWDDQLLIEDNVYLRNWSSLPRVFTQGITGGAGLISGSYRPLQIVSYMLDYSLWGMTEKGYHLTNVLLHILAGLTFFWLINIFYGDKFLAGTAGILFIIHPIHTEAVSYVSGRSDSLAALFLLLAFIFYLKSSRSRAPVISVLMLLSYVFALLSRENSLILPFLLLLYHYAFREKIRPARFFSILIPAVIYVLLRLTIFKSFLPTAYYSTTLGQRIPGFFAALTGYLRMLILPRHLHMEYGNQLFTFNNPGVIAGIALLAALLFLLYVMKRTPGNPVFFSLAWFLIALLPSANLYPINAYMAEHWLYLPSIGFFLLLARLITSLYRPRCLRIPALAALIGLIIWYSNLTVRQNRYWREPIAFYERTLKYAPASPRLYTNLAGAYQAAGEKEKAMAAYRKSLELNPDHAETHNNLGSLYGELGRTDEAIASFRRAIEADPDYVKTYYNLGLAYGRMGKKEEAIAEYEKAVEIYPDYAEAYNNLGNLYGETGDSEKAIAFLQKAVKIDPDYAKAYYNLGLACSSVGRYEEAISAYIKAAAIEPGYANAYYNLGIVYTSSGRREEAVEAFRKAIAVNPDFADAYYNLGNIFLEMGDYDQARELYKKTIEKRPDHGPAHNNLAAVYYREGRYDSAVRHCDLARKYGEEVHPEFLKLLEPHR